MTRTERAKYPRALNRDRSESRTGLDNSIRKGGAGGHNWGSLADESFLEARSMDDENMEPAAESVESDRVAGSEVIKQPVSPKPPMDRTSSDSGSSVNGNSLTEEEKARARKLRKNAFKGDQIDLATIARTSGAVTTSPPNSQP